MSTRIRLFMLRFFTDKPERYEEASQKHDLFLSTFLSTCGFNTVKAESSALCEPVKSKKSHLCFISSDQRKKNWYSLFGAPYERSYIQ